MKNKKSITIFKMPKAVKISGRSSSLTNAFFNGVIPCVQPNEQEVERVLKILGIDKNNQTCSYCGDKASEWDHFRPLVDGQKSTGYISEINNLVPSCGKCNQSKGNTEWKNWMRGSARLSPTTRGVVGLQEKIKKLERFEKLSQPIKVDLRRLAGVVLWKKYQQSFSLLMNEIRQCQKVSDSVKRVVANKFFNKKSNH